jgi:hypothetical protein
MQDYMQLNISQVETRPKSGRLHFYAPDHPLSIKGARTGMRGWVNAARHVASVTRGKWLSTAEVVRYRDGNYQNVSAENLLVVCRSNLPAVINYAGEKVTLVCPVCQQTFEVSPSLVGKRVNHSRECQASAARRFEVTPEALLLDVWSHSTVQVGEKYEVSDKAIEKRCKRLGVPKPPRGYWRLIELGWAHEDALRHLGWTTDEIVSLRASLDRAEAAIGTDD